MKTCYYYQTFVGLEKILNDPECTDVIIVSSIHFDKDEKTGKTNIYLNDNTPDNKIFDNLWKETKEASDKGITITLMVGGAGGAYGPFFNDYQNCYSQLINLIKSKPWIKGIDLDIEESVKLSDVQKLIENINTDLSNNFIITMAPVGSSLINDDPGMGSFSYKKLYNTHGRYIHWFNTQCYNDSFSFDTFNSIVKNGYPPNKIVMGMMSGDFNNTTFKNALNEVHKIKTKYPMFKGVFDWEYLDAPPVKKDPSQWAKKFKSLEPSLELIPVNKENALNTLKIYAKINGISPRRFKDIYIDMITDGYTFVNITKEQRQLLLVELRLSMQDMYPVNTSKLNGSANKCYDETDKLIDTLLCSPRRSSSMEDLFSHWEIIDKEN